MIELKNIEKSYKSLKIFENMSADFSSQGCIYSILGESGSGKTTLLHLLFGIDQNYSGQFLLKGKDVKTFSNRDWDMARNETIQIVYQDYKLLEELSVYDNLKFAINKNQEPDEKRIVKALEQVDLQDFVHHTVKNLSGGQKQRLALARATINHPQVLLLDEPTGNLDDKNTQNIMAYIKKLKDQQVTVIIITHDFRILEDVDVVYQISNKNFVITKGEEMVKGEEVSKASSPSVPANIKKQSSLSYVWSMLKVTKKETFITYLPTFFIFMVFILLFNMVYSQGIVGMESLFKGLSDTSIVINVAQVNNQFRKEREEKGQNTTIDVERLAFSQEDLEKVKKIPGVARAEFVNFTVVNLKNYQDLLLNLTVKKDQLPKVVQAVPSFANLQGDITYTFHTVKMPYEYRYDYNPDAISIMFGDFPKDQSKDVLIPDIYALQLAEEKGVSIEQLIGQEIVLPAKESTIDGVPGKETDTTHLVCGIYGTRYANQISQVQTLYLPYELRESAAPDGVRGSYEFYRKSISLQDAATQDYLKPMLSSFEAFEKAYGTGENSMIIRVEKPDDLKRVTQELDVLFPNYMKLSQYDTKHGETANTYQTVYTTLVLMTLGVALIFGIIVAFMNKSVMLKRNKKMSILYSLGYSRLKVMSVIFMEIYGLSFVTLIFSYIVIGSIQKFYLQYTPNYQIFQTILDPTSIFMVCVAVVVIMFVSVLWSLFGVNKKKLKQYLEG